MAAFSREEMEDMVDRWLAVNSRAEREGNWRCLADFYTADVIYGWETPNGKYEFNDREVVRDTCVGAAMDPYKGWTYPYEKIVIDEKKGEVFATWWQVPPGAPKRDDGSEMKVIGASWFKYGGDFQWSEQMDMYDYGNIVALITECVDKGILDSMPLMSKDQLD